MKIAPLTFCLVCAAPAFADVAVPQPANWRDGCAVRIDETARRLGLPAGARTRLIPLLHEDGTPNPVQYVEYATPALRVVVGDDAETHPDQPWHHDFRRLHHRFAKIDGNGRPFRAVLDECLKMGETK